MCELIILNYDHSNYLPIQQTISAIKLGDMNTFLCSKWGYPFVWKPSCVFPGKWVPMCAQHSRTQYLMNSCKCEMFSFGDQKIVN